MFKALLSLALLVLPIAQAAYCSGSPDEGSRTNEFPILDDTVTFVKNGINSSL